MAERNFLIPVGEIVDFDTQGYLTARLTTTAKAAYNTDEHGDYEIITAFPLLKNTR